MQKQLEKILADYRINNGNIISILQNIENEFGYIPEDAISWLSNSLNIPASKFYGVVTFYSQFHLKPRGKNILTACCGTACHVKGSNSVINRIRTELAIPEGEDTTDDAQFTLESVACVGACSIAPVLIVNKKVYGKIAPEKVAGILKEF